MRTVTALLLLCACAPEPAAATAAPAPAATPAADPAPAAPAPAENDPRWHATLRAIAGGYTVWGRVDDEMRWAPWLCRMPLPARARISDSGDDDTHGRKLYTLYAKDPVAYGAERSALEVVHPPGLSDISQVVVKEAWKPVESAVPADAWAGGERRENLLPAREGGKAYVPGERAGLYIMFRAADPAGTDDGWVYGTLAPDLQTITAAGKVSSCMGCHQQAPKGRLFGLPARERAEG